MKSVCYNAWVPLKALRELLKGLQVLVVVCCCFVFVCFALIKTMVTLEV